MKNLRFSNIDNSGTITKIVEDSNEAVFRKLDTNTNILCGNLNYIRALRTRLNIESLKYDLGITNLVDFKQRVTETIIKIRTEVSQCSTGVEEFLINILENTMNADLENLSEVEVKYFVKLFQN